MPDLRAAWESYWPRLRAYAYAVAYGEHVPGLDAEDVAAELLLRMWRTASRLGLDGFPHWGALRQSCRWRVFDLRKAAASGKRIPEGAIMPLPSDDAMAAVPDAAPAATRPRRHRAQWTAAEDEAIRDRLGIIGYRALAGELGRSVRALAERASELGVRMHPRGRDGRPRTWSESEEDYLRIVVGKVAAQTGKAPGAVASRIAGLYKYGKIGA